jgi:hypothetical protein
MTRILRLSLLLVAVGGPCSCKSQRPDAAAPGLANITQAGDDVYANLRVPQDWIAKESLVSLRLPSGESLQVHLNPVMHHGTTLRLHGKGATTAGALFLTLDTLP